MQSNPTAALEEGDGTVPAIREDHQAFRMRQARYQAKMSWVLLFSVVVTIYRTASDGLSHSWMLGLGAIASFVGIWLYSGSMDGATVAPPDASWGKAFANWAALVPFLYGLYLTCVQGLWHAWRAFRVNDAHSLVSSLIFTVFGWLFVKNLADLSDLYPALRSGRLIVDWPQPSGRR